MYSVMRRAQLATMFWFDKLSWVFFCDNICASSPRSTWVLLFWLRISIPCQIQVSAESFDQAHIMST